MIDRFSKWAIAGSLAWLVMAIGLILGTHGDARLTARTLEAPDAGPAPTWSVMPAASTDVEVTLEDFKRC